MLWLAVVLSQGPGTSLSPVDSATSSITGYVLGYGPVGVIALALAWLLFRGWRLLPPGEQASIRGEARAEARTDLVAERERLLAEKQAAEEQRDDALRFTRDNVTPLLLQLRGVNQCAHPDPARPDPRSARTPPPGRHRLVTEPDDVTVRAAQLRAEAEELPTLEEITALAERAVAHGGTPGMSLSEIRDLAEQAVAQAEQVTHAAAAPVRSPGTPGRG